jgi:hypothetical protein
MPVLKPSRDPGPTPCPRMNPEPPVDPDDVEMDQLEDPEVDQPNQLPELEPQVSRRLGAAALYTQDCT